MSDELQDKYKTTLISSQLSAPVRDNLSKLVDELWNEVKRSDNKSLSRMTHETYKTRRDLHLRAATIATFCDHDKRRPILDSWNELQGVYLPSVKTALMKKKHECAEEADHLITPEIEKLSQKEAEYKKVWDAIRKTDLPPSEEESQKLAQLGKEIAPLKEYRKQVEGAKRIVQGIDEAVRDLDKVAAMDGVEKMHYLLLGSEAIIDQLKQGTYKGLPHEPFEVVKLGIQSAFTQAKPEAKESPRPQQITPINPAEKPAELVALLYLKQIIDGYASGKNFNSSKARSDLPNDYPFSGKLVGSYLRNAPEIFGITNDGNIFQKTERPPLTEQEFLGLMVDKLGPSEQGAVNKFYITRALDQLREDPRGYDGFTVEDVFKRVRESGFPITTKAVAVNLGRFSETYGVHIRGNDEDGKRVFEFKEIIATDKHREAVRNVIGTFGYKPFTVPELSKKIYESKSGTVHLRVLEHILDKEAPSLNLEKASQHPPMYRTTEKPKTAAETLAAQPVDVDTSAMY